MSSSNTFVNVKIRNVFIFNGLYKGINNESVRAEEGGAGGGEAEGRTDGLWCR